MLPSCRLSILGSSALLTLACAGVSTDPPTVEAVRSLGSSGASIPIPYGAGRNEAPGCHSAHARAFNFWIGEWSVLGTDGAEVGTNRVEPGLNGCAILEAWVDASGFPGRSLSSWDSETQRWRQMFVDAGNTTILLEGGELRHGVMELRQERPSRFGAPVRLDVLTWTKRGADVQQSWRASSDGGQSFETLFDATYRRADVHRPTPRLVGSCTNPARPRFFDFDFTLGRWQVTRERPQGDELLGTSHILKDMENCLLVETFAGAARKGAGAIGFGSFDFVVRRWHREFADAWGRRVVLSDGVLVDGRMVLQGVVRVQGEHVPLRVTWEPVTSDRFVQRWEISVDGGVTWRVAHSLRFDRLP